LELITAKLKIDLDPLPRIEGLKQALVNKVVRKAIVEGVKPILKEVKNKAKEFSKSGASVYGLATKTKTKDNVVWGLIGMKSKYFKGANKPVRYFHCWHQGTKFIMHTHPILKQSWDEPKVRQTIGDLIRKGIAEQLNK
jgi:hypothetical protein